MARILRVGAILAPSVGLLILMASLGFAQREPTPEELAQILAIFGNGSSTGTTPTPLSDFTVEPTQDTLTLTNDQGEDCKCVPYFLCNADSNTIDPTGEESGYGVIDIRFSADRCTESAEVCCKEPLETPRPTPKPPTEPMRCGQQGRIEFQLAGSTGREALFGEFPWTVALLLVADNDNICVGSLIHPNVVLTAAHCVDDYVSQPDVLKARAGEWDTQTEKERLPFVEKGVTQIVIHEGYRPKTLYNDIALVRLSDPIELDQHINLICLPPQGTNDDESKGCYASGWGKDVFGKGGAYAVIMKKVPLDCMERKLCQLLLQQTRLTAKYRLSDTFVCAGGKQGLDTCQGDGGAPLVCPSKASQSPRRFYQAGIVSWGIGCGQKNVPAVYARVGIYRTWIDRLVTKWGYDPSVYTI